VFGRLDHVAARIPVQLEAVRRRRGALELQLGDCPSIEPALVSVTLESSLSQTLHMASQVWGVGVGVSGLGEKVGVSRLGRGLSVKVGLRWLG